MKKAIIVSFEGIDGCGKSTQAKKFVNYLRKNNFDTLFFREPGTTKIGKKLRKILLSKNDDISFFTELLLYLAARNELVEKKILPEIFKKKIIVLDRFIDSTLAYQGYGRKLPLEFIEKAHQIILRGIKPDLTFVIDSPAHELKTAIGKNPDRLEKSLKFQERVRKGYKTIATEEPERVKIVKRKSIEQTFKQILDIWNEFLDEHQGNY
ncbi:MAG: dTMP kinase [Candidatus Omnitrophica bacterium]|nr:dTMP kinase [Candidatus Omnitrophota bacterium]